MPNQTEVESYTIGHSMGCVAVGFSCGGDLRRRTQNVDGKAPGEHEACVGRREHEAYVVQRARGDPLDQ
jgi:hypothetical protein